MRIEADSPEQQYLADLMLEAIFSSYDKLKWKCDALVAIDGELAMSYFTLRGEKEIEFMKRVRAQIYTYED